MSTRSQKKKAVEESVSVTQETPLGRKDQGENPKVGTSKSPKFRTENSEETNPLLKKKLYLTLQKS